jgi:predicted Zn-dependent protease
MSDKAMFVKMAFLYVQSEEWYKAVEEYKKLLAIDRYDPHVYNMMGDAYAKKKDDKEAFEAYLESRDLYGRVGNTAKVAAIDKKIAKLSPQGMETKQRQFFQSILKTIEADRIALEGNLEEAIAQYLQLITAEPRNFSYREKLAALYLDHAHVTEAVAQYKALAEILLSEEKPEEAQVFAGKMSLIDPEGLDTLRLLGELAEKKKDQEGIAKHFGLLAQGAFGAGQWEEANLAVEKAAQAGRSDLKPLQAKILLALKKPVEAKRILEEPLRENPEDEGLQEQLLALAEETKDWNDAHLRLEALLQKRPEDPLLKPRQAKILLQVGKRAEAVQIYMGLGLSALKDNKTDAALSFFDTVLSLEADQVEALKKKAEIYIKLGKKAEVIETYKKLQGAFTQKKLPEEARKVAMIINRLSGFK